MKLYFKYMKLHFKSALQYKKSFMLSIVSQFFVFFTFYFTIVSLFSHFSNIKGYTVYQVLLTFSVIQIGFALNETFCRGIDIFDELIIAGEFDRILVKPQPVLLQSIVYKMDLVKLARVIQGIIILVIAVVNLGVVWNFQKVLCLIFMIISSFLIFFGIFVLAASYCFFTVQGLEVRNLLTDGGKHMAQYPIGVFRKGFVFFFTFIIPYGIVNYYPLLYIIDKTDNILYCLSPLLMFIFLIPCILVFKLGSKKYTSCGS